MVDTGTLIPYDHSDEDVHEGWPMHPSVIVEKTVQTVGGWRRLSKSELTLLVALCLVGGLVMVTSPSWVRQPSASHWKSIVREEYRVALSQFPSVQLDFGLTTSANHTDLLTVIACYPGPCSMLWQAPVPVPGESTDTRHFRLAFASPWSTSAHVRFQWKPTVRPFSLWLSDVVHVLDDGTVQQNDQDECQNKFKSYNTVSNRASVTLDFQSRSVRCKAANSWPWSPSSIVFDTHRVAPSTSTSTTSTSNDEKMQVLYQFEADLMMPVQTVGRAGSVDWWAIGLLGCGIVSSSVLLWLLLHQCVLRQVVMVSEF